MPMDPAEFFSIIFGVPAVVVALGLILRFKLRAKELEVGGGHPELGLEVEALRDDLNDTREQLVELQERVDFAERLLAAPRASQEDRS